MAEVFNTSPFMLGKRGPGVLSPHHHNHFDSQEYGPKKRRLFYGDDITGEQGGASSSGSRDDHHYSHGAPKRMRTGGGCSPPPPEMPQFSQRQVDEQLQRLRSEYTAFSSRREEQMREAGAELARLAAAFTASQRELEKSSGENKILRRAVTIQNTRCRELEGQLTTAQQAASAAGDHIRRLEQANYAMALRIGSIGVGAGGEFTQRGPPDVY